MSKLTVIHSQAGAIDIGASELFCSTFASDQVEIYGYDSENLQVMAKMFVDAEVKTVAIEATGVYWIPVYEALEDVGLEVYMVNGAHVKQIPGRKNDIADAVWLRTLHQYGLLRSGFVPEATIRCLRTYMRIRENHIQDGGREVLRMQKALDLMGLKIHQVLSQIQGKSGLAILEAILDGERDPDRLISLTDKRVREKKSEELRRALKGNYRKEYLFLLSQAIKSWRFHQNQILECDKELTAQLAEMTNGVESPEIDDKPKKIRHHPPQIPDLHKLLLTLTGGKNPTRMEGINDQSLLKLIAHCGLDFTAWKNEKHFVSYASLAPSHDQSGRRKRRRYRKGNKEIKNIFILIARSVAKMKTELGEFYRHLKSRKGPQIAMKALARKIAVRFYNIMRYGIEYTIKGIEDFQQNFKEQKAKRIFKQLKNLNLDPKFIKEQLT